MEAADDGGQHQADRGGILGPERRGKAPMVRLLDSIPGRLLRAPLVHSWAQSRRAA